MISLLLLAAFLMLAMLTAQQNQAEISIAVQAAITALAPFICQLLRHKPLTELMGKFNLNWLKELCLGGLIGSTLMLMPVLILGIFGWVDWERNPEGFSILSSSLLLLTGDPFGLEASFPGLICVVVTLPLQLETVSTKNGTKDEVTGTDHSRINRLVTCE